MRRWAGIAWKVLFIVFMSCFTDSVDIAPVLVRIDELDFEVVQIRGDLLRVEEKIRSQIDIAKISLASQLERNVKNHVRGALAEILQGESVEEMVRSQIVSEVRQLRRENQVMKTQIRRLLKSLQDVTYDKRVVKESTKHSKETSSEIKCTLVAEGSGTNMKTVSWNTSNPENISTDLKEIRSEQKLIKVALNTTRQDLLSTKSEVAMVKTSLDVTGKDLLWTKSELATIKASLNITVQDVSSAKSVMASLRSTLDSLQSTFTKLGLFENRIQNLENATNRMEKAVIFQLNQVKDPVPLSHNEILKFDEVTSNIGNAYNPSSGKFTAPVTGTYFFWANIMCKNKGWFAVLLKKDGHLLTRGYTGLGLYHGTATIHYVAQLSEGEQVWFANEQHGNTKAIVEGFKYSNYGGSLIAV